MHKLLFYHSYAISKNHQVRQKKLCTIIVCDDVVEAPCYVVDIGRTDHEQIRSTINNN